MNLDGSARTWRPGRGNVYLSTAAATLAFTGISGLAGLYLARSLGPSTRGVYAAAFAWFVTVQFLGELGMSSALVYYVSRHFGEIRSVQRSGRRILLISGLATAAVGVIASAPLSQGDEAYRSALLMLSVFLPVSFLAGIPVFSLQATSLTKWNISRVSQPVVFLSAVILLGLQGRLDLTRTLVALVFSTLVQWSLASLLMRVHLTPRSEPQVSFVRPLLRYGMATLATTIPMSIGARMDVIFLTFSVSSEQIGLYAVAATVASLVAPAAASVGYVMLPRLAREGRSGAAYESVWRSVGLATATGLVGAAITACGAWILIPHLLGQEYSASIPLALILAVSGASRGVASTCRDVLRGLGFPSAPFLPEAVSLGLQIVLLALLVPRLGSAGAAFATSGTALILLLGYFLRIRQALSDDLGSPRGPWSR